MSTTTTPRPAPTPAVHEPGPLDRLLDRLDPAVLPPFVQAIPLAAALLFGLTQPRSPADSLQALAMLALALLVGLAAGATWRSRWAFLVTPSAFLVGYELSRLPLAGPTVEGPHLSLYGLIALAAGRGLIALVVVAPMLIGVGLALGAVQRRAATLAGRPPAPARLRVGAALALLAILAVAIGRPATTAPIVGQDGTPLAGSVAELTHVEVDGRDLGLMIRGASVDNPVLLFLAGGPGGTELGAMRRHLKPLEDHVTVATWDQRGAGRSYDELDPTHSYTIESAVADTIAVTEYLRERFDQERILLVGQSYGTFLGVLAVQQRPDLYRAYIGTGQMVDAGATDRITYADTLAWARDRGDDRLVDTLVANGPPPYDDLLAYEPALANEPAVYAYDHSRNAEGAGGFSENLLVPEYSLVDLFHTLGGFLDTFGVLYPQLQSVDLRESAMELQVPVYLVQGANEIDGRRALLDEWYPALQAPTKRLIEIDTAGHRPLFERPERFVELVTDTVLPETAAGASR
jgi:pimeloyl-ACP methyl ester carboxylesterase